MFFAGFACARMYDAGGDPVCSATLNRFILGAAHMPGNLSINTSSFGGSWDRWVSIRVTQHEWAHNYGANHGGEMDDRGNSGPCTGTCVMTNDGFFNARFPVDNVWCSRCVMTITHFRQSHPRNQ